MWDPKLIFSVEDGPKRSLDRNSVAALQLPQSCRSTKFEDATEADAQDHKDKIFPVNRSDL